MILNC